jgi:hypothetical protein
VLGVEVVDDDAAAFGGELARHGFADAGAGTGHQADLVSKPHEGSRS